MVNIQHSKNQISMKGREGKHILRDRNDELKTPGHKDHKPAETDATHTSGRQREKTRRDANTSLDFSLDFALNRDPLQLQDNE